MPNDTTTTTNQSAGTGHTPRPPAAWLVLVLACAGQAMVVLDVSIVNVALPAMRSELGFDPAGLAWVVNAYTLAFASLLLLGGRAVDLYGSRRVFVAGLAVFAVASLAGGLATSPQALIVARAAQGVGGAILSPATLTLLTTTFSEGERRTRAVATWSAVGAAAGAVGSVLGGVLTDYLSWRWVLLINVPIGAAAVVAALLVLPAGRPRTKQRLDLAGAVTVTVGLTGLAYGVMRSETFGWATAETLVPLTLGVVALLVFVAVEAFVAKTPLVPLRLFRTRAISSANLVAFLMTVPGFAMWYFLSLSMQNVLHYSAMQAGLAFLPHTLALIVGARLAPRLLGRLGARRLVVVGLVVSAAGFAWQGQLSATSGLVTGVVLPGILMSLGMGLAFPPVVAIATSGVARSEAGLAAGILTTSRQVGGALGLAVLATISASHIEALSGGRLDGAVAAGALAAGYARAFDVGAALLVVVALIALTMPNLTKPTKPNPAESAAAVDSDR
ncbi:MFS transporter [Actinopolymorpha alba]|uniref:MFS transporter n=1 Tax=Actinopolymorpha alba TaxID=533267 RepID=UPI00039E3F34|nr:MFS transporter [Actinopolymorpha alba]